MDGWMGVYEARDGHMSRGEWAGVEAKRGGRAPWGGCARGLLTCRLHISEVQSSLIFACWVTEALLFFFV